jgi:murein DD-endopeptidase MepM/ murein hydrolase activator NlpD
MNVSLSLVGLLLLASPISAAPAPPSQAASPMRTPPFTAVIAANSTRSHAQPEEKSPELGTLRKGATVTVTACVPDCAAKNGWAVLGSAGAVKLSALYSHEVPSDAVPPPPAETLLYGRVGKEGTPIYKEPKAGSTELSSKKMPREMAFLPNEALRADGWFERADGGFVLARGVTLLTPSKFQGEPQPKLPLAIVLRELGTRAPGKGKKAGAVTDRLHRYDRLPATQFDRGHVVTERGSLPRSGVRLVLPHARPEGVPADARWVHINLAEQTLTAYEGDRAVYATLVSSGKGQESDLTHPGLFRLAHKMVFTDMHGEPDEPYTVDRVPYAVFFNEDEALHGTYWHDGFGAAASHGCVNLSFADAKWIFEWAPPTLPPGFSAIEGNPSGAADLWVLVEEQSPEMPLANSANAQPKSLAKYSAVAPLPHGAANNAQPVETAPPASNPQPAPGAPPHAVLGAHPSGAPMVPAAPAAIASSVLIAGATPMDLAHVLIIPVEGVKPGQLTDTFGDGRSGGRQHGALDIMAPHNALVIAATDGTVYKLFESQRGGTTVNQLGADGITIFYYAHLDHYAEGLKEGQALRQGDVLGYVGDTGDAKKGNYHLHFAIWHVQDVKRYWEGININPYPLLAQSKRG